MSGDGRGDGGESGAAAGRPRPAPSVLLGARSRWVLVAGCAGLLLWPMMSYGTLGLRAPRLAARAVVHLSGGEYLIAFGPPGATEEDMSSLLPEPDFEGGVTHFEIMLTQPDRRGLFFTLMERERVMLRSAQNRTLDIRGERDRVRSAWEAARGAFTDEPGVHERIGRVLLEGTARPFAGGTWMTNDRTVASGYALNVAALGWIGLTGANLVAWGVRGWNRRRRRARMDRGECPHCRYDRSGLAEDSLCPECGREAGVETAGAW